MIHKLAVYIKRRKVINMGLINKAIKFVFDRNYRFLALDQRGVYNSMDDKEYLERKYESIFNIKLDLENPKTFNQKMQWLKLYYRRPEFTQYVDKYAVREYIANMLGEEYLVPLLGVWDNPNDIDFDKLPNRFVLKCNHNSGLGMCICKNKDALNTEQVINGLQKGLEQDYYLTGREWPYKNVKRKVIAEKYLVDESGVELKDYKLYCFDGKVKLIMINSDRNKDCSTKADYFDADFNHVNMTWGYEQSSVVPSKPLYFEEMKMLAEKLSKGMPHVRIDFYIADNRVYFGEMTFFDGSGFDAFGDIKYANMLGEWIKLPEPVVRD